MNFTGRSAGKGAKVPVGVSACLLGEPVRFDGGHKRDDFLTDVVQRYVDFYPACPELTIGLGVPRAPIRLISTENGVRVKGATNPALDVTDALRAEASAMARDHPELCGYIFMHKSPSCGLHQLKRYDLKGDLIDRKGRGAYAEQLTHLLPLLPVEESERLTDPEVRDNFFARVFALQDWKYTVASAPSHRKLVDFYSRYKYQVMAHHVPSYQRLGRLVGQRMEQNINTVCDEFLRLFMQALTRPASRGGNVNALLHLRGYFGAVLGGADNEALDQLINAYQQGAVPLSKPVEFLRSYLGKVGNSYLSQQSFWAPYPVELRPR